METTYAIKVNDDYNNSSYDLFGKYDGYTVAKIAFRGNDGEIYFTNPFAQYLQSEIEVIALDNDPQGIFTVGGIIKEIEENIKKELKRFESHRKELKEIENIKKKLKC